MVPMTITTLIILNGIIALGLLTALALVMYAGHRAAGSESAGTGDWTEPLEPELVRATGDEPELERAA
jgi:hypothetical protein